MSEQALPEPYGTEPLTTPRVVVKDSQAKLKEHPHLYGAGSEPLAEEEMRITALGTLGNGDVFIRHPDGRRVQVAARCAGHALGVN